MDAADMLRSPTLCTAVILTASLLAAPRAASPQDPPRSPDRDTAVRPASGTTSPHSLATRAARRGRRLTEVEQRIQQLDDLVTALQEICRTTTTQITEIRRRHDAAEHSGPVCLDGLANSLALSGNLELIARRLESAAADAAARMSDRGNRARLVHRTWAGTPAREALAELVEQFGISVVHRQGAIPDLPIDATMRGVDPMDAAAALLSAAGLRCETRGGVLVVLDAAPPEHAVRRPGERPPTDPVRWQPVRRSPTEDAGTGAPRVPGIARRPAPYKALPQAPNTAFTTSVKPGINDNFLDPELDVGRFVQRFEGESREIFTQRTKLARAVGLEKGMAVADIGAGTGLFLDMFAKDVGPEGRVFLVDLSPKFVQHLRNRSAQRGYRHVDVVQCTERSTTLPRASVDRVFICDTYHHFEYPAATMASIHEALRPGGELILVDFERIPGVTREWLLEHVRAGKTAVLAELDRFGFDFVEEIRIDGLTENYCVKLRRR